MENVLRAIEYFIFEFEKEKHKTEHINDTPLTPLKRGIDSD